MNLEAINSWDVSIVALRGNECGVNLKYDVVEGCAKVRAVYGRVSRGFWVVDVFTFRAVELDCFDVWIV